MGRNVKTVDFLRWLQLSKRQILVCAACPAPRLDYGGKETGGYWLAVGMLGVNMAGSAVNVISGTELRVIVGIPIVLFLLGYLVRPQIRKQFH
jgi:hypothetical protein